MSIVIAKRQLLQASHQNFVRRYPRLRRHLGMIVGATIMSLTIAVNAHAQVSGRTTPNANGNVSQNSGNPLPSVQPGPSNSGPKTNSTNQNSATAQALAQEERRHSISLEQFDEAERRKKADAQKNELDCETNVANADSCKKTAQRALKIQLITIRKERIDEETRHENQKERIQASAP